MNVGLDIGSYRLRSLHCRDGAARGRACRCRYAVLPDSQSHQSLLKDAGIPFAVCDDSLILFGDAAVDYARLFQVDSVVLLPGGHLPRQDPLARQIIATLIDALLPEPNQSDSICCFTCSAESTDTVVEDREEQQFFSRLLRLKGYAPLPIGSGMATVLAELGQDGFSGIAIVLGNSTSVATLAHRGVEVASTVVARGGDWVAEQLGPRHRPDVGASGTRTGASDEKTVWTQSLTGSVCDPRTAFDEAVASACRTILQETVESLSSVLSQRSLATYLIHPLRVVCTGGLVQVPGMRALLEDALRLNPLPVPIRSVHATDDSDFTVSRGCLIRAELEADRTQHDSLLRASA